MEIDGEVQALAYSRYYIGSTFLGVLEALRDPIASPELIQYSCNLNKQVVWNSDKFSGKKIIFDKEIGCLGLIMTAGDEIGDVILLGSDFSEDRGEFLRANNK